MWNSSESPPVISLMTGKLKVCALLLAILASACGQATSGVTSAAASDKVAAPVARAVSQLEAGQPLDGRLARHDAGGRIEVYVYVTVVSADTVKTLAASGLKDAVPSPPLGLVQGWIAPRDVSGLAALAVVTRITLPRYAEHI